MPIGIAKPVWLSCVAPVLISRYLWQDEGKEGHCVCVQGSGHWARKTTQAKLGLDLETHGPLPSLSWGGSHEYPDQPVSVLETKWIRSGCEISFEREMSFKGEISSASRARSALSRGRTSFKSRQDQLRVEHEARVELWSSLLVGGIVASLLITRATPGTSASCKIKRVAFGPLSNFHKISITPLCQTKVAEQPVEVAWKGVVAHCKLCAHNLEP